MTDLGKFCATWEINEAKGNGLAAGEEKENVFFTLVTYENNLEEK